MKRSHEPVFWSLFGAGGMLSALIGPVLILVTGIAVPLGLILPADAMSFERMSAFMRPGYVKFAIASLIALFLWHGCHRLYHLMHDLGIRAGTGAKFVFYGFALVGTLASVVLVLAI